MNFADLAMIEETESKVSLTVQNLSAALYQLLVCTLVFTKKILQYVIRKQIQSSKMLQDEGTVFKARKL